MKKINLSKFIVADSHHESAISAFLKDLLE